MNFQMNLPQVVSIGGGVSPTKSTRIGIDARWFSYESTAGFSKVSYNADGSVAGFRWKNIWAVGGGVQQQVSKSIKLMAGYNYSQNPVPAQYTFFNTPAPAIVQHHVSGGIFKSLGKCDLTATYYQHSKTQSLARGFPVMGRFPARV
jgi:long-chain fatty acid transport protein